MNDSEFGKGLTVNLIKFYEHFSNDYFRRMKNVQFYYSKTEEERELIISDDPPPNYNYGFQLKSDINLFLGIEMKVHKNYDKAMSSMITSWANGASDHLYEIEIPKEKGWSKIRALVNELARKGLEIGHGFTEEIYKFEDILELEKLVRKISLMIDEKLGLKPDWGQW